jgi:hypothetical protein
MAMNATVKPDLRAPAMPFSPPPHIFVPAGGGRVANASGWTHTERTAANADALAVIGRLDACLDEETAALARSPNIDLAIYINRKGQGLLELNRAIRLIEDHPIAVDVSLALASLRKKIEQNTRALRLNIAAVKEISCVLADAIQSAESDGTYSSDIRRHRGAI